MKLKRGQVLRRLIVVVFCACLLLLQQTGVSKATENTTLSYRVRIASEWSKYKSAGKTAGSTKSEKSITNIELQLNSVYEGNVQLKTYADGGWCSYANAGDTEFTSGKMEAIKVRLTGDVANYYDVYYQVHLTGGKWTGWAMNGKAAGSIDLAQRINAIRITLVNKGGKAPGSTKNPTVSAPEITYTSALKGKTFSDYKALGKISGAKKSNTPITAIKMKLKKSQLTGTIEYRLRTEKGKFGDWISSGNTAGKNKDVLKFSGLQIRLTEQLAKAYDVYYRVRIQNYGWLDWTKNGKTAGSKGLDLAITAYQVKLVKKVSEPEYETELSYIKSEEQEYVIRINKQANCITVYLNKIPIKAFITSTGEATPTGTFHTIVKYRWHQLIHEVWGQYCTRIVGHILFHSVPYRECNNKTLMRGSYNKLGTTASAGCVRLTCGDAKWIYDNCKLKTKVIIYKSEDPGPLGKPKAQKLPPGQNWDPTDPAFCK